jgi:cysteinyl-tRNA synthetase
MALTLYNTLTRRKDPFVPLHPPQVGVYTCGPTVYSYQHIGNLRTYVFEDILVRMLRYDGYNVKRVMNITDVGHLVSDADEGEDRMAKAARLEQKDPLEIAAFYTRVFFEDFDRLNCLRPDVVAPATEHIPEMIALIECLQAKGVAYEISDGVYFDVSKFPDYGKLSRLSLAGQEAGARVEVNPEKRGPFDFALWKRAEPGHLQQWPSPWGQGYPGWHIECSAMSMEYLGPTFDIHCGGIDHIPVHHENEIAQSEACTGEPFVRVWLHGEFMNLNNAKISKRDLVETEDRGRYLTVGHLAEQGYNPLAYRYLLLGAHYRTPLNYTQEALDAAATALNGIYEFVRRAAQAPTAAPAQAAHEDAGTAWLDAFEAQFQAAIDDDLNMPRALATVHDLIREANRRGAQAAALPLLFAWDAVLGLRLEEEARREDTLGGEITRLVQERQAARTAKDWARADAIRDQIKGAGYELEDTPQGVRWKRGDATGLIPR